MSAKFTVTCPHCGSTTTVHTGVAEHGEGHGTCKACGKGVWVKVAKGEIVSVRKG